MGLLGRLSAATRRATHIGSMHSTAGLNKGVDQLKQYGRGVAGQGVCEK